MKVRVRKVEGGGTGYWLWCPGCDKTHRIDDTWGFDGDVDKPTFTPSILVQYRHPKGYTNANPAPLGYDGEYVTDICHSFIRSGQWEFLPDSTHKLAGQTLPMVDLPAWMAEE